MDKHRLYLNAFINVVKARIQDEENKRYIKQNALYGVKLINTLPEPIDYDDMTNRFQLASAIKVVIGLLTPAEFMNVFPIEKEFDGHKYGVKDYFYTIEYINTLDKHKPIGEEISKFLWEYNNWEIRLFTVAIMGIMSDIRSYEGKPSLAEEWASMNGMPMYTKHTDHEGNEYLVDQQGRTQKFVRARPTHLKLVK